MLRTLILSLLIIGCIACSGDVTSQEQEFLPAASIPTDTTTELTESPVIQEVTMDEVYICMSGSAVAFHASSSCREIQRCSHGIESVSQASAQADGYRACKICW